jgi:hypothetical protein
MGVLEVTSPAADSTEFAMSDGADEVSPCKLEISSDLRQGARFSVAGSTPPGPMGSLLDDATGNLLPDTAI